MKNNVIKVIFKNDGREDYAESVPALFERYTHDDLGCVIGTVMNNLWKNNGFYENDKVKFIRVTSASVLEQHLPENALRAIL